MMIGAQLYTLREYTKTPADIAKTFARVKKMGYNGVQCSALGPIDPVHGPSIPLRHCCTRFSRFPPSNTATPM